MHAPQLRGILEDRGRRMRGGLQLLAVAWLLVVLPTAQAQTTWDPATNTWVVAGSKSAAAPKPASSTPAPAPAAPAAAPPSAAVPLPTTVAAGNVILPGFSAPTTAPTMATGALPMAAATPLPLAPTAAAAGSSYTPVGAQDILKVAYDVGTRVGQLLLPASPSEKDLYPISLPSPEQLADCFKNVTDPASLEITACKWYEKQIGCQQLAALGYLPAGVQAFTPGQLNGLFSVPYGCGMGNMGVLYDGVKLLFDSPTIPILAVITKDLVYRVAYYGTGVTTGKLLAKFIKGATFCYAPTAVAPLYVVKTSSFSYTPTPGDANWSLVKAASVPAPYTPGNVVSLVQGDALNATWQLSATKTGVDVRFQAYVTGQIALTNPQPVTVTVYTLVDGVMGGPGSTVICSAPLPFRIPPCSTVVCQYVTQFAQTPANGTYSSMAVATYSVDGFPSLGTAQGSGAFIVAPPTVIVGALQTTAGPIPAGSALITDALSPPPRSWIFQGTAAVSYTTTLQCPPGDALFVNTAYLTASTGQQVMATGTIQKRCVSLQVQVAVTSSRVLAAWQWRVQATTNTSAVALRPSRTSYDDFIARQVQLAVLAGQSRLQAEADLRAAMPMQVDMSKPSSADVQYRVTYTKTLPASVAAGRPSFEVNGTVVVLNPSSGTAQLQSVTVTMQNPLGGNPVTFLATCNTLTIPAGQRATCGYRAAPPFNPAGASVTAAARYLNMVDGQLTGAATDFYSGMQALVPSNLGSTRKLMQSLPPLPEPLQALANLFGQQVDISISVNSSNTNTGQSGGDSGTVVAGSQQVTPPPGLPDNCVTVSDTPSGIVGPVVMASRPSGTICSNRTFTYVMRLDGFTKCFSRNSAATTAAYRGADTGATGSSRAATNVTVTGCTSQVNVKISGLKTSAQAAYVWSLSKTADPPSLVLLAGLPAAVRYTVQYQRQLMATGAVVNGTVTVTNIGLGIAQVASATGTLTTTCGGNPTTRSFSVAGCTGKNAPPGSSIACSFSAAVPCVADGTVTVSMKAGNEVITSTASYKFADTASNLPSACANVSDTWRSGTGLVTTATIADGARPSGRLCASKTYTYTAVFPPFAACGTYKAVNVASYRTSGAAINSASDENSLIIDVTGCPGAASPTGPIGVASLPEIPAKPAAAKCVRPVSFWASCMANNNTKGGCATINKLSSGSKTRFFPKSSQKTTRDYRYIMTANVNSAGQERATWLAAGKSYIAAQLNRLADSPAPNSTVQYALKIITNYLDSTTTEGAGVAGSVLQSVQSATAILSGYSDGTAGAAKC